MAHNSANFFFSLPPLPPLKTAEHFSQTSGYILAKFRFLCQIPEAQSCSEKDNVVCTQRQTLFYLLLLSSLYAHSALEPVEHCPKIQGIKKKSSTNKLEILMSKILRNQKQGLGMDSPGDANMHCYILHAQT